MKLLGQDIDIDSLVNTCMFLGVISCADDLPSDSKLGDMVHVLSEDAEYLYTGEAWERLGEVSDVSQPTIIETKTPFSCVRCGGNKTSVINGKVCCAFCGTELITTQVLG